MRKLIFVILFLLLSSNLRAVEKEKFLHIYGALGQLYNPASFRIGHKTWELGLLNRTSIGLAKLLYKGNIYAGFGPIISINSSFGVYGSVGVDIPFLKLFSFRAELNGTNSIDNYGMAELLLGATIYW